ncbi:uncharacterized protein LOC142165795 [Nicotiana tabacum]|uniref:Uncharacterized protein LOC142165795 n=1 Tax=Nicotiana tabacum TaxID=4097 RepID=A0AC58S5K7_TOBAC
MNNEGHGYFEGRRGLRTLKLTHLLFADDLMIFCKWDIRSIQRIMEALNHFSCITRLVANSDESNIFLAGLTSEMQEEIIAMTGFVPRTFPIKYLGLPLSSKKWSKMERQQLLDKITKKDHQCLLKASVLCTKVTNYKCCLVFNL